MGVVWIVVFDFGFVCCVFWVLALGLWFVGLSDLDLDSGCYFGWCQLLNFVF